jgi:Sulfotransferase family
MIYINHDKKAIFIHIPKTGGSYIGPTLEKYYGFNSYLTLIANRRPDHDIICREGTFRKVLTGNNTYDNSFFNKFVGLLTYCKTSDYFNKEMNMDEEKWKSYTKFCFIRNPYDRALSGWRHFNKILNLNIDFNNYINRPNLLNNISDIEYGHIFMSQKRQIQDINGLCGIDLIGRFENLESDLRIILNCIGFYQIVHPIKKVNVSNENGSEEFSMEYKTIKKLNELFADDFDVFHYRMINI